jgi:hypothetical protein
LVGHAGRRRHDCSPPLTMGDIRGKREIARRKPAMALNRTGEQGEAAMNAWSIIISAVIREATDLCYLPNSPSVDSIPKNSTIVQGALQWARSMPVMAGVVTAMGLQQHSEQDRDGNTPGAWPHRQRVLHGDHGGSLSDAWHRHCGARTPPIRAHRGHYPSGWQTG